MPLWSTAGRFPWPKHHTTGSYPTKSQKLKNSRKGLVTMIQKSPTTIHRIFELLRKLHTQTCWKTYPIFLFVENNWRQRQTYYGPKTHERIPKPEQYIGYMLPTCPSPTTLKQTANVDDWRQLQGSCIRSPNWRWLQSKALLNKQDLRTSRICVQNIHPLPDQNVNQAKELVVAYFALKENGLIYWDDSKPSIIMTDNKSVKRVFQTKKITPPFWNACDFVLQFKFVSAHNLGKKNTAAAFLSRPESGPNEKVPLKIQDIIVKPLGVNIEPTGIALDQPVFKTN